LHLDPNDEKTNSKTEKPIDYLVMDNQYPIVFLAQRARDIGYELKAEEPPRGGAEVTFHFGPSTHTTRTIYKLEWGKTLVSFQPSFQVANQVAEVTVKGWNPRTKKEIKVTVKRSEVKGVVAPSELGVEEPELAKKEEIIADHPVSSKEEARGLAEARMKQIGVSLVTAKGKTIGLPDLRAGEKVEIEGVGRFSGMYFVTSTTHTIGEGGYTTDFTARREK
jgi:phage protein D